MISKVEAFSCPDCHELYYDEFSAYQCFQKHQEAAEKRRQEEEEKNAIIARKNYIRLNLESFSEFPSFLDKYAESLGYKCSSNLTGKVVKGGGWWDKPVTQYVGDADELPCFKGTLRGTFKATSEVKEDDSFFHKDCLSDFIRYQLVGVFTGSGGVSDGGFYYEIRMFVQDFPKIDAKYQEFFALSQEPKLYAAEQKRLMEEYQEYLVCKKIADIPYQLLSKEQSELESALKELRTKIKEREIYLDSEKEARTTVPKSERFWRYQELKERFGFEWVPNAKT